MKATFYLVVLFLVFFNPIYSQLFTPESFNEIERVNLAGGPEDFALDTVKGDRLIISCDDRREKVNNGSIWVYNINEKTSYSLYAPKQNEFVFHPHGIHLLKFEGDLYLFVINHSGDKKSEIDRFIVYEDSMILDKRFEEIIGSPNDIFAITPDEFFYSDYKMNGGSIIQYKNNTLTKLVKHLRMPNGIYIQSNDLYFATTLNGHLYKYNMVGKKKRKVSKVKGGDNLMAYSESELLLASHPNFIKFTEHVINGEKLAPTLIYKVNINTNQKQILYAEKGENISAASTALFYENQLFLGQIFEPFLLIMR